MWGKNIKTLPFLSPKLHRIPRRFSWLVKLKAFFTKKKYHENAKLIINGPFSFIGGG